MDMCEAVYKISQTSILIYNCSSFPEVNPPFVSSAIYTKRLLPRQHVLQFLTIEFTAYPLFLTSCSSLEGHGVRRSLFHFDGNRDIADLRWAVARLREDRSENRERNGGLHSQRDSSDAVMLHLRDVCWKLNHLGWADADWRMLLIGVV